MKLFNQQDKNRDIAHHILGSSTTMIGVCITVITLFKLLNTRLQTYADELLSFDTLVFTVAALFSYASLRSNNNARLEQVADIAFFLGLLVILLVAFIIVFTTY
ncbi:hypothetical protein [Foetidibacter luteolus]|uniref:hypothetical protein n=1 Tax=Foetidibacter luteolus TaxID=2608880 RepID=UPI00129B2664|nr:hypothetical protein [Foetidibacter luteolus]